MAGATFSRVKNWAPELLTNTDLNAEIDNILNHLNTDGIDDYSTNATQMRITTDPGESGTESLATSLSGELERLRFAIKEIKGSYATYWYSTPNATLTDLLAAIGGGSILNRLTSGRHSSLSSQPLFLVPHGTNRTVSVQGASTNFLYTIAGTAYTMSTAVTSGTLTAAPSSNNTCLLNDANAAGQPYTKQLGEFGTILNVDNMGSEITGLTGKLAGFKTGAEYFIAKVESATQLTGAFRGFFFDSADATLPRVVLSDNDTITLMKLTWIFAKTDGTLAVTYNNPRTGSDTPTSPAIGDYWFDTANSAWKIYDSSSFITANAILIGVCLQNTTGTIAARSCDFFKGFADDNSVTIERLSNTEIRSKLRGATLNVYGTVLKFTEDYIRWDITADLASGVTEAASTVYYLYVTEGGESIIDSKPPHDRTDDRRGYYHPFETWRCIGEFYNNASSNINGVTSYLGYSARSSYGITPSIAASALTLTLTNEFGDPITPTAPLRIDIDDGTTNAKRLVRYIRYPLTLVVTSGATLGHPDARQSFANIYAMDTAGSTTVELAISSRLYQAGNLLTTVAMSNSADLPAVAYSLTARTAVPAVRIGLLTSTQTTAGTWATAPTIILQDMPMMGPACRYTSNNGQTMTRNSATVVKYEDVVYDYYNSYDISTGLFTAPWNGRYGFRAAASVTSGNTPSYGAFRLILDGSAIYYGSVSRTSGQVNSSNSSAAIAGEVYINAAQTIALSFMFDDAAADRGLVADAVYNNLEIVWLGF